MALRRRRQGGAPGNYAESPGLHGSCEAINWEPFTEGGVVIEGVTAP